MSQRNTKKTTEEFIADARKIHGDKWIYDKTEYKNNKAKVCITCPIHGDFWQTPSNHLSGCGCLMCAVEKANAVRRLTLEAAIAKAREIHGDKYDYSESEYANNTTKTCIICPIHGKFHQTFRDHLRGHGCPKCGRIKAAKNTMNEEEEILNRIKEIHKEKLSFDKFVYSGLHNNSTVTCRIHGDFDIPPIRLLHGNGCKKCANEELSRIKTLTTEEFIRRANIAHDGKYGYEKVVYVNSKTPICITCHSHGDFWQIPNNHLMGCGCPRCNQSKLEEIVRTFLIKNDMKFISQGKFDWLINEKHMKLDFYLPDYNVAIECQGGQHFFPVEHFGGEEVFKKQLESDSIKRKLCEEHGIKLLYYSNLDIEYPYKVFTDLNELLEEIKR